MYELCDRQADGARDSAQQHDRDISLSRLELRQISFGYFCMLRQRLTRHTALIAQRADSLAEPVQIGIGVAAYGGLGAGCFHQLPANMHYNARQEAVHRIQVGRAGSENTEKNPCYIELYCIAPAGCGT